MYVYSAFPGDEDREVARMQHDLYSDTLSTLFHYGLGRGLYAEQLMGLHDTDLGNFCRTANGCDHRVIQDMHDQIAAYFRFTFHRWPLFESDRHDSALIDQWRDFAFCEFKELCQNVAFATAFFEAVRYPNKERGLTGEAAMAKIQQSRYSAMHSHCLPRYDPAQEPGL